MHVFDQDGRIRDNVECQLNLGNGNGEYLALSIRVPFLPTVKVVCLAKHILRLSLMNFHKVIF
jgi:hypothetical protein